MEPNLEKVQGIRKMTQYCRINGRKIKGDQEVLRTRLCWLVELQKKKGKFHKFCEEEIAKLLPKNMAIQLDGWHQLPISRISASQD